MAKEKENEDTVTVEDISAMKREELVELITENELAVDHENIKTLPALKKAVLKATGLDTADEAETDKSKGKGKSGKTYTYIGGGEDSPRVIHFMGRQKFVRGQATEVTDPDVLAKLEGASTFVEGEADQETLHKIDEDAKAQADAQRAADIATNARYTKKHRTE